MKNFFRYLYGSEPILFIIFKWLIMIFFLFWLALCLKGTDNLSQNNYNFLNEKQTDKYIKEIENKIYDIWTPPETKKDYYFQAKMIIDREGHIIDTALLNFSNINELDLSLGSAIMSMNKLTKPPKKLLDADGMYRVYLNFDTAKAKKTKPVNANVNITLSTKNPVAKNYYDLGEKIRSIHNDENLIKAGAYYKQAIKEDPNFAEAYLKLGEVYHYLHRTEDAIENLNKAIALNPYNPRNFYFLGLCYKYSDLFQYFKYMNKAIQVDPSYYLAYQNLGSTFSKIQKYDYAILYYKELVKLKPYSFYYSYLSNCFYQKGIYDLKNNNYKDGKKALHEAINYYKKTIELNKNNTWDTNKDYELKILKCLVFLNKKNEAISGLEKYLEKHPKNIEGNALLGYLYKKIGKTEKGEELITESKILSKERVNQVKANREKAIFDGRLKISEKSTVSEVAEENKKKEKEFEEMMYLK